VEDAGRGTCTWLTSGFKLVLNYALSGPGGKRKIGLF
jgi:hypothetical protein